MVPPLPLPDYIKRQIDLLTAIECDLKDLKTSFQSFSTIYGAGGPMVVNVLPPRSNTAIARSALVTSAPQLIRAANENRLSISIVNSSAVTVYLGIDDTVTDDTGSNEGYELLPFSTFDDDSYTGAIYGVVAASSGNVTLTFWEE